MAKSYRTYGEFGENTYDPIFIKQPDDHSCGLRSQQIILRDFGIDIPFEDLERYAFDAGIYSENGTYTYDIGKVLEMAGVGMHQVKNGTIYDLTNELAQGHRVIVSVDAHELWYNDNVKGKLANWFNDVFGSQGGNHALIVAGVEVNPQNPKDTKVVLTDPGSGHLRIEYPLNQFMDAWKDSNCFMAATDEAAPYQYDIETGMEVPSNFAVEHQNNQFVAENSYQLDPDMINVPVDYQPAFTGHLDMVGDMAYDDYTGKLSFLNQGEGLSHFYGDNVIMNGYEIGEDYSRLTNDGDNEDFGFGHFGDTSDCVENDNLGETAGSVGLEEGTGSVGSLNPDDLNNGAHNVGL